MKKYLAFDAVNTEYESFDTLDDARKWLTEGFLVEGEGYHPDMKDCCIYELKETVDYDVIDKKSNYKYENEEDIPDDDTESEAWPYGNEFDEIWKHKFIDVK